MEITDATAWIAGASAIGTASFGIVEMLKGTKLGDAGAAHIVGALGRPGEKAFAAFYGEDYEAVIRRSYRSSSAQLGDQLKDALRIALRHAELADEITEFLGQRDEELPLSKAVRALEGSASGQATLSPEDLAKYNARVATYTMAVDARVSAACAAAASYYEVTMKGVASVIAISLSVVAWALVSHSLATLGPALLLGIVAVPIAPIASDVTSILQTASDVLLRRSRSRPPS